jgi:proline racemase
VRGQRVSRHLTVAQSACDTEGAQRKNAASVSTGKLDRAKPPPWTAAIDWSPCRTGTCAKMAALHAKGQVPINQDVRHEGILGTTFTDRLVEETRVGPYAPVVPTITGHAWITGLAQSVVEAENPFPEAFTGGDISGRAEPHHWARVSDTLGHPRRSRRGSSPRLE